jgi:serine/threonine-protein kinase HipA
LECKELQNVRSARVYVNGQPAAVLQELTPGKRYAVRYDEGYAGPPVSLTMPVSTREYKFGTFPSFFEGLLPEGDMLESLLRQRKIDASDYFSQLLAVGHEMVGAVTVEEMVE